MGTSVNLSQIIKEKKVIVMSVIVMSVIAMGVAILSILVVSPIIGIQPAIVSIPIVNGGIVATRIMTDAALEKGLTLAAGLGALVFAVQKFVGTIPASRCGLSEARVLVREYRDNLSRGVDLLAGGEQTVSGGPKKTPFYVRYDKYFTAYTTLGIGAGVTLLSDKLAGFTGLAMSIWCLLFGMVFNQLGLVPPASWTRANRWASGWWPTSAP